MNWLLQRGLYLGTVWDQGEDGARGQLSLLGLPLLYGTGPAYQVT